ncbi:MAG TPA: FHA domain-containing protein [Chloroflexi bacterium]|nr:FHA domain-containing protein [Chloroflexota bacterium]
MTSSSFRLIVRTGPAPGTVFDLTKDVTMIGRDVTNEVVLGDAEVSRQHARLTRTPGGFVLEDLGSTNGTFVNGERLVAPRVLNPGDLVAFGENVTLTFDAVAPEAASTVASAAAKAEPAPPPAKAADAPAPKVSPAPQAAPAAAATPAVEKRRRSPWLLAGIGCFVLVLACGGFLWFMDAFYPEILYAPLRIFGFY